MTAAPRLLVLLLVALQLQTHYAKYYLIKTDGEAVSVPKKHIGSKTFKTKTKTGKFKRGKGKASSHTVKLGKQQNLDYSDSHGGNPGNNLCDSYPDYGSVQNSATFPTLLLKSSKKVVFLSEISSK